MASYIEWIRSLVGKQKILLVFASACVTDPKGRVLWQFRSDFHTWGLPGGVLELDETLEQCVVREVKEETGLDIEAGRLVGIYTSPRFDVVYPNGDQVQQVTFCFQARLVGGRLQGDPAETRQLAWFDPLEPPETFAWYRAMISDFNASSATAVFNHGRSVHPRPLEPFYKQVRKFIGHQRLIIPAAIAFVQNQAGEVLLIQRQDTRLWELPGGCMELGEQVDQAAEFETLEESGLSVAADKLLAFSSADDLNVSFPNGDQLKCVTAMFRCRILAGTLHHDGVESAGVGFFDPHAWPPLMPGELKWINAGLRDAQVPVSL